MSRLTKLTALLTLAPLAGVMAAGSDHPTADLVVSNARIYTASATHAYAGALAVRDGRIVFVGRSTEVAAWIGPATKREDLKGAFVLPGIIDSHIHPTGIVDLDVCDLKGAAKTLAELTTFVRSCIERYRTPPGDWLSVHQWSYWDGNQSDPEHPTLRAALDLASRDRPIQLLGTDGHHGAFNSAALARARTAAGEQVGLSRATLRGEFAAETKIVGIDAQGEPNGAVNERARHLMGAPTMAMAILPEAAKVPEKIMARLNGAGITGILDAAVTPEVLAIYDRLEKRAQLTVRVTAAQFYDPEDYRDRNGEVEYQRMVDAATAVRARYASDPLIYAGIVKLYADGYSEGNPYAVPPTLPEAAALRPYLQPIFAKDAHGRLTVTGYVDTDSALCREVRASAERYASAAEVADFINHNGYHPDQCSVSSGELRYTRAVEMEFVKRFHLAGFAVHIHAVGDAGVRTAIDAIEAARAADGISSEHDALAHVQVVHPDDVRRIGRDHLYLACTFWWASYDPAYDMSIVPFFDRVHGNDYAALHPANGYFESAVYPFRSMMKAGAILLGGSDAPVGTHDPQPLVNIAVAVTRQVPGQPPLTPAERIAVEDALDAYTINGARYLGIDRETGSIEIGKSADFVVLDRDPVKLAAAGQGLEIANTRVLETWFRGANVYRRARP